MQLPDNVRFLVLDTETTGVSELDKVVEIAYMEVDENFNILQERQTILDPEYPISPSASGVHGLVNADCESFPTIEEFFSVDDPSCLGTKLLGPVVLIGHRIGFDYRFMKPYIPEMVLELCTLRWARRLYPDADDHKLSTLIFSLDLPRSLGAHRAMADVYSAMYLAKHICERTGMTLRQLAEASAEPMEVKYHSFGKHKGTLIADTPKSYLRWMKENLKDIDMDLRHTIDLALNNKK